MAPVLEALAIGTASVCGLMLLLWLLHLPLRNAAIVDAGWAGGLALLSVIYAVVGDGHGIELPPQAIVQCQPGCHLPAIPRIPGPIAITERVWINELNGLARAGSDAQQELPSKLQDIMNYMEILKSVNLIEM
jgi:hypothetical protein